MDDPWGEGHEIHEIMHLNVQSDVIYEWPLLDGEVKVVDKAVSQTKNFFHVPQGV